MDLWYHTATVHLKQWPNRHHLFQVFFDYLVKILKVQKKIFRIWPTNLFIFLVSSNEGIRIWMQKLAPELTVISVASGRWVLLSLCNQTADFDNNFQIFELKTKIPSEMLHDILRNNFSTVWVWKKTTCVLYLLNHELIGAVQVPQKCLLLDIWQSGVFLSPRDIGGVKIIHLQETWCLQKSTCF